MIKVQLLDDHKMVAQSLMQLLNQSATVRCTAVYYDVSSCTIGMLKEQPDILLLDISLKGSDCDGIQYCKRVKKSFPAVKVIMLTVNAEYSSAMEAKNNGASGYIIKGDDIADLLNGIEEVHGGNSYYSPIIERFFNQMRKKEAYLTPSERDVLCRVAHRQTRSQIALERNCSENVVNEHIQHIYQKLKINTETDLVLYALSKGIITIEEARNGKEKYV